MFVAWRPKTEHGTHADLRLDPAYRSGRALLPGGRFAVYSRGGNDCQRAAVATALDVDYAETPAESLRWSGPRRSSPFGFWQEWSAWAAERGLVAVFHDDTPPIDRPWWIASEADAGPWGQGHSLVMRFDTLVLDPSLLNRDERVIRRGLTFDREHVDGRPVYDWLRERVDESQRRSREATARERSNR